MGMARTYYIWHQAQSFFLEISGNDVCQILHETFQEVQLNPSPST